MEFKDTLKEFIELNPEHISAYSLKVEEGTVFYRLYKENKLNLPSEDIEREMYYLIKKELKKAGYNQYEISNFCRRSQESKHNLKYWTGGEYLGFGPDASSDFAGKRFKMVRDLHGYIEGILTGGQVVDELQEIPPRERAGEYLMMRLRTSRGILGQEYEKQYLLPFAPLEKVLVQYADTGHAVKLENGYWRLTPEGFLISNSIIAKLLI